MVPLSLVNYKVIGAHGSLIIGQQQGKEAHCFLIISQKQDRGYRYLTIGQQAAKKFKRLVARIIGLLQQGNDEVLQCHSYIWSNVLVIILTLLNVMH